MFPMNRFPSIFVFLFLSAILTGAAGCEKPRDPPGIVRGQVTNAGKPVTDAVIYFEKEGEDYSIYDRLDASGNFQMKTHDYGGLPEGTYRVAIRPDPAKNQPPLAGDANKAPMVHPLIPPPFMKAETSGLRVEVKKGANPTIAWDLGKK